MGGICVDIKWLQTFVIAGEHENFRIASEILYISQPTVTVQIRQLEEVLGLKLFKKAGRNIVLTEAGRKFLPHAKGILERYDQGVHEVTSWLQGYNRKLILAVSPLIASSVLPYVIHRFTKIHPNIEVDIQVIDSIKIGEFVQTGKADIGLSLIAPSHMDLIAEVLYEDPVVLVAPHDGGDFESSPPLDLQQLLESQVLITGNHPAYWDALLLELRQKYAQIRTMVVSQIHITKRFIEEGLGFSFLPKSAIRREILEGRFLEVHTNKISLPIAHTFIVTKNQTEEVLLFKNFLQSQF